MIISLLTRLVRYAISTLLIKVITVFLGVVILSSCKNDIDVINTFTELHNLPSQSVRNLETIYTDSGKIEIKLLAPELKRFSNVEEPYIEFPAGIKVVFYDKNQEPESRLTAKYAIYSETNELWEARDSVIAINNLGDTLNTELLFWDEKKELIYTNKFVKITTENEVIWGEGLEANQEFTDWKIKNVKGIIYIEK
ncbi:MAG: LPS export ABC transporter periplasmic protein LptC [Bacteroidales bacterium]|nr:LPS export ABC transporter periplasmic protein LptC [Bacteroidales bacterium]